MPCPHHTTLLSSCEKCTSTPAHQVISSAELDRKLAKQVAALLCATPTKWTEAVAPFDKQQYRTDTGRLDSADTFDLKSECTIRTIICDANRVYAGVPPQAPIPPCVVEVPALKDVMQPRKRKTHTTTEKDDVVVTGVRIAASTTATSKTSRAQEEVSNKAPRHPSPITFQKLAIDLTVPKSVQRPVQDATAENETWENESKSTAFDWDTAAVSFEQDMLGIASDGDEDSVTASPHYHHPLTLSSPASMGSGSSDEEDVVNGYLAF